MRNSLIIVLLILSMKIFAQSNGVEKGTLLPTFKLQDENGNWVDSQELKGKSYLVVYFYPKDDTPGCTKEACSFRDNYDEFEEYNARIIGISSDDVASHKKFKTKHNLPYTLLADVDKTVRKQFDVPADLFGLIPGRVTYIFDLEGNCIHIFDSQMSPLKHISESLEVIKEHQKK